MTILISSRSGSRQRNEYQQRIDKIRQYIDPNKLVGTKN